MKNTPKNIAIVIIIICNWFTELTNVIINEEVYPCKLRVPNPP